MNIITRAVESTIKIPGAIEASEVVLKNKFNCQETTVEVEGEVCGGFTLLTLTTDLPCGEYELTAGDTTTTVNIQ